MCWSAGADLTAGSAVCVVGVACVASVRRGRDLPLAALPLVLGIHQLIESVVWRGVNGTVPAGTAAAARAAWAVIALPLLPAFVPLAVLCAAPRALRARLAWFVALGLVTCAVLAADVVDSGGVSVVRHGHILEYGIGIPLAPLVLAGYLVAAVGSLLASGDGDLRLLGAAIGVGAAVCALVWTVAFASTWCALAAVVSVLVLRWVRRRAPDGRGFTHGPPHAWLGRLTTRQRPARARTHTWVRTWTRS